MLMDTVTEAYLEFAIMTLVSIGFPVGAFIASYFLRPIEDPNDRTKVRSILLPGYDRDHTCLLYTSPSPRDLSTSRMPSSA